MLNSNELMRRSETLKAEPPSIQNETLAELCVQISKLTALSAEFVDFANDEIRQSNEKYCAESMHGLLAMLNDPDLMMSFKARPEGREQA